MQTPKTDTSVHLEASSTDVRYHWFTAFLGATGFDAIKGVLRSTGATGNFDVRLAIEGELALSIADDMWVQFGLLHSLTSGTNGGSDVTMAVAVRKTA